MADLSKINLNGTIYNFKDTEARNAINNFEETDPTVPEWAKQATKPTYTASEVGAAETNHTHTKIEKSGTDNYGRVTTDNTSVTIGAYFGQGGTSTIKLQPSDIKLLASAKYSTSGNTSSITFSTYPYQGNKEIQHIELSDGATTINGIITPTTDDMAANKKYVDDAISSITIPTTVSSFTNDSGYQTSTQVQSAINTAIGNINSFEVEVVSSLPTSNIQDHTIYFVPQAVNSSVHDEYMYINNAWELIGTTTVDLSNYLQTTDIAAWAKAANKPSYTAAEVGALPDTTVIPTKTSDLINDSNFVRNFIITVTSQNGTTYSSDKTFTQIQEAYNSGYNLICYDTQNLIYLPLFLPLTTNEAFIFSSTNMVGFNGSRLVDEKIVITNEDKVEHYFTQFITSTDISNWNAKSNFSGSYNDLTNKPTIPTNVSSFTNDAGYLTLATLPVYDGSVTDSSTAEE